MTEYYADTSEFQVPYTSSYPYPVAMFRAHSGYVVDPCAPANWAYHKAAIASGRTRLLYAYVVFVPGQLATVMAGIKGLFGPHCPTNRLVIVIDMESGRDFAGPGNHSAEANIWVGTFWAWGAQVDPYANVPDYAECWPNRAPGLTRLHISKYSSTPPAGAYSWQYYGATDDPSPMGAPRSCPPFGIDVDMNVIYRSIEQIELDYGITKPVPVPAPPVVEDDEMVYGWIYPDVNPVWCIAPDLRSKTAITTADAAVLRAARDFNGKPMYGYALELAAATVADIPIAAVSTPAVPIGD